MFVIRQTYTTFFPVYASFCLFIVCLIVILSLFSSINCFAPMNILSLVKHIRIKSRFVHDKTKFSYQHRFSSSLTRRDEQISKCRRFNTLKAYLSYVNDYHFLCIQPIIPSNFVTFSRHHGRIYFYPYRCKIIDLHNVTK